MAGSTFCPTLRYTYKPTPMPRMVVLVRREGNILVVISPFNPWQLNSDYFHLTLLFVSFLCNYIPVHWWGGMGVQVFV